MCSTPPHTSADMRALLMMVAAAVLTSSCVYSYDRHYPQWMHMRTLRDYISCEYHQPLVHIR